MKNFTFNPYQGMIVESYFIPRNPFMITVIEQIQAEDPSFDPLTPALEKSGYTEKQWEAATDRIYFDGYYGPLNDDEWKEQDGREPYTVKEALVIVAKVLEEVDDYRRLMVDDPWGGEFYGEHEIFPAEEIRRALVPWFKEIYGYGYPTV